MGSNSDFRSSSSDVRCLSNALSCAYFAPRSQLRNQSEVIAPLRPACKPREWASQIGQASTILVSTCCKAPTVLAEHISWARGGGHIISVSYYCTKMAWKVGHVRSCLLSKPSTTKMSVQSHTPHGARFEQHGSLCTAYMSVIASCMQAKYLQEGWHRVVASAK